MATYRGTPVAFVAHNRGDDTYSLFDEFGDVIAIMERHEYLSQPQLRSMRLSNGRDRPTPAKDQRSPARKPRDPWDDDPFSLSPGAINSLYSNSNSGVGSGLTASMLRQQMDAMMAVMAFAPPSMIMPRRPSQYLGPINEKRPTLKRDGVVAGEIVGYRCWRVEKGLLRSVYQTDIWKPGAVLEGRELGDWDSRGIHAWKDPASKEYHDYIRGYLNSRDMFLILGREPRDEKPAMVTGTIFMWGDVVEHERGWRAEYARVRSLDWLYPDETMMGREQATLAELHAKYSLASGQRET